MSSHENEHQILNTLFGREETPGVVAVKSQASIYHRLFIHNKAGVNDQILNGIKRVALRDLSKEDIQKLEREHASPTSKTDLLSVYYGKKN